jgi:hypothetical protein
MLVANGSTDLSEMRKASDLAKTVIGQTFEPRPVARASGDQTWTATVENTTVVLKRMGQFEGDLSDPNALELVTLINKWCPSADQSAKGQAFEIRARDFQRTLKEHRTFLQESGPMFEYHFMNGAWGYVNHGCLIGETGSLYTYDELETPGVRLAHQVDEREYARALDLAKSLGDQKMETRQVAFDAGTGVWTMTVAGTTTALKESGINWGELSDPNAVELVRLISGWCPAATDALRFEQLIHRSIDTGVCAQPDPSVPIQTCTPPASP